MIMTQQITDLFYDPAIVVKIQQRLPRLFQMAELESSRAGKVGMEVGSMRERILIALLIHRFGEDKVATDLPITQSEVDVIVLGRPLSIKTATGSSFHNVKLIWTVDAQQAAQFGQTYEPSSDMLFVQINWGATGGLFYITKETQLEELRLLGHQRYMVLPAAGTNPRGVEISPTALRSLTTHRDTRSIPILWQRQEIAFNPYQRWLQLWTQDLSQ
jgi:hypothetical protein